jgi:hypothetical protein
MVKLRALRRNKSDTEQVGEALPVNNNPSK